MKNSIVGSIIKAGLIAGSLDIIAACSMFYFRTGRDPMIVLKFVASGLLGQDAMSGGWGTNVSGLLIHFSIAFGWTILFFVGYPKLPKMNWVIAGLLYGIVVWLCMNLIVLPMTRVAQRPFDLNNAITGTIVLMLAIGLPVSYFASKYYSSKS